MKKRPEVSGKGFNFIKCCRLLLCKLYYHIDLAGRWINENGRDKRLSACTSDIRTDG